MQNRFKSLITAAALATGLSFALPLQAQPVDKTGRFPAPQAQPASSMGGMMMDHMHGMSEKCCDPATSKMQARQTRPPALYMDAERNLNENRRHMDYQTRQLLRELE